MKKIFKIIITSYLVTRSSLVRSVIIMTLVLTTSYLTNAQVGINDNNASPDASAMLDVKSSTKGMLIPRMTTTERDNINSPATGLMVYNTTTNAFNFYNGTTWIVLSSGTALTIVDADNDTKVQVEKTADDDIIRFDLAGSEKFRFSGNRLEFLTNDDIRIGENAGLNIPTTDRNIIIGKNAVINSLNNASPQNVVIGNNSLVTNAGSSGGNVVIGHDAFVAGSGLTEGDENVVLGKSALGNMSGFISGGVVIGHQAMANFNSPSSSVIKNNIAIGSEAMKDFSGDSHNIAIGWEAMKNAAGSSTQYNIAIGRSAGRYAADKYNIYLGYQSGYNNTGNNNIFLGRNTGFYNTGSDNVFIGENVGHNNTGSNNIFLGDSAGYNATGSNLLYIENTSSATPLIWGNFANDIVKVYGTLGIKNEYQFPTVDGNNGQVLKTDGAGNLSWTNQNPIVNTDNQKTDVFQLNGTNLELSLENDGVATKSVNLSSLKDNLGNHTATQNIKLNSKWLSNDGGNEGIQIDNSGSVTLSSNLNISPSTISSKITFWGNTSNHYGFGVSSSQLNYHVVSTSDAHVFYAGGTNGNGTELVRIKGNGVVGIGTNNPTNAKLVVNGAFNSTQTFGHYGFSGASPTNGYGTHVTGRSIYASNAIACGELQIHSDERIKNIINTSNSQEDLATLLKIQITDYQLKDTVEAGNQVIKKVIAQQVKSVYPEAVDTTITETVPDIYQMATIQNGWIALQTNLKAGERVKIITENKSKIYEVTAVEHNRFKVNQLVTGNSQLATVFVYGREINNFHTVDYDAISMLNVSATQELYKIIQTLQTENKTLKLQVKTLNKQVAKINQLEAMLLELQVNSTK